MSRKGVLLLLGRGVDLVTIAPRITYIEDEDELFCQYPGQYRPQPCVLVLDLESGELTARYNPETGNGIPMSVFNHRTLWTGIPCLTATAANALLDAVSPLAQRILDGATIEWDGHNHVGYLDDDANAAYTDLAERCDPQSGQWSDEDTVSAWDANDWFGAEGTRQTIDRLGITATTTDEEIAAMAEAEKDEARSAATGGGFVILSGAENHLRNLRDDLAG